MTRERITIPRDRKAKLADYYELINFGECHERAATRAGFTNDEARTLLSSEESARMKRAKREREMVG